MQYTKQIDGGLDESYAKGGRRAPDITITVFSSIRISCGFPYAARYRANSIGSSPGERYESVLNDLIVTHSSLGTPLADARTDPHGVVWLPARAGCGDGPARGYFGLAIVIIGSLSS